MPFRFKLDSLLRLRRSQEHMQELRLASILAEVAQHQSAMDKIAVQISTLHSSSTHQVQQGTTGAELIFLSECGQRLVELQVHMQNELQILQQRKTEQQMRLRDAHQAQEVLASLFQQQSEEYALTQTRLQQLQADEQTLRQHCRKTAG